MDRLWIKFLSLSPWKQVLIALLILILFPLAALAALFYLEKTESSSDEILEHSVDMMKRKEEKRLEKAKQKDKQMSDRQKDIQREQASITKKMKNNISKYEQIENKIDKAETISALQEIARNIRGRHEDSH